MAKIKNPKLAIQVNLPGGMVQVDITCDVIFTENELFNMDHGLKFRLDGRLWGADWPDGDDALYGPFLIKRFKDASPTLKEHTTFSRQIPSSTLDEDYFTDEVYARLTLTNLESGIKVNANTNEISHSF